MLKCPYSPKRLKNEDPSLLISSPTPLSKVLALHVEEENKV